MTVIGHGARWCGLGWCVGFDDIDYVDVDVW